MLAALINRDMRTDPNDLPRFDLIITEAPKLEWMPKEEIERGLNKYKTKYAVVFCDYPLNLDYPCIQYSWDQYTKHPSLFCLSHINKTTPGAYILDPFMGYAHIGELVIGSYRNFVGIEIDKNIFNYGKEKLEWPFSTQQSQVSL